MNSLKIMIGQLGLVRLTNRKTGRRHVNKRISRRSMIIFKANCMLINFFTCFFSVFLLVNQTRPNWPIIIVSPFIRNWKGDLVLMVFYVFIPLLLKYSIWPSNLISDYCYYTIYNITLNILRSQIYSLKSSIDMK